MNLTIIAQKDNPLFSRKEVVAEANAFSSTPSRAEVTQKIADHFKTDPSLVFIQKIDGVYGGSVARISAAVYSSAQALATYAHVKRRTRGQKKEAKAEKK